MAKDRIVKFGARIGPRSAYLVMTNCPLDGRGQGHVTSSFLANKCKTQIYLQWKSNKK